MKYLQTILLILGVIRFSFCSGQQDNEKTFNQTYQVDSIPNLNEFNIYNDIEKRMDSIYSVYDFKMDSLFKADNTRSQNSFLYKKDFRNNRSRIFLSSYTNDKLDNGEFSKRESLPMPCDCYTGNDTLYVSMVIGFFGGEGFEIKLFDNKFQSAFFEYIDDVKPYKSNLSDTAYTGYVTANSKYQTLIVNEKPTFKSGQQLTGFLTFTSNDYYILRSDDKLDSTYVTGKLYFTCKTKQKIN
jgi:hypothetical protein